MQSDWLKKADQSFHIVEISFSHIYDIKYIVPAKIPECEGSISQFINVWNEYFNNNSRILFMCNTPCNIPEIFKFQWYIKKMYSCFQAIIKFIIMEMHIKCY